MDDPRRRPALKAWQLRILVRLAACIVPETATAFISRRPVATCARSAYSPSALSLQPFGIKLAA
jgi:hypothetical protein